ncbi:MAG: single-stranded-DNA-specific exonuclease RecJ [Patescibacteria group bacterium]
MKQWQVVSQLSAEQYRQHPDIEPVLLQLLYNRGLSTPADIEAFFADGAYHDPFLFRDMAAAADLIISHIKAGDKIIVYGDYDADGVTASVILLETLQILQAKAEVYLPDRVSEGYGLNRSAIDQIAAQGGKLIVTVDNGIRNREEVIYAQSLGLDIIITDHHVLPEDEADLPPCLYIDPADPHDHYPWKYLAGVGVSFKLVSALLAKSTLSDKQKQLISAKCLDLVAIGTVTDLVSLLGENRQLVKDGLEVLNQHRRLGLDELIREAKINSGRKLEAWNIGWQIGPRLNAASRLAHANSAFALLTTTDPAEARELAAELNRRNSRRQQITEEIMAAVEAQIDPANLPLVIFAVAGAAQVWNEGVVGLVAGRIAEKYYRPTLIVSRLSEESETDGAAGQAAVVGQAAAAFKGSGRSVEEFNLIAAVETGAAFLDKYGGHPMACGFSVKGEENLRRFQAQLAAAAASLDPARLVPKLKIEAELSLAQINLRLAETINSLAPFGQNNPQPRFASYDLRIDDIVTMGADNQHVKLRLSGGVTGAAAAVWAIAFGAAADYQRFRIGDRIDLAYYLEINEFNGRREPQLKIIDLRSRQDQDLKN